MADLLISLVLGGVAFFVVKWLIFRKPFPYPLSIAEQHKLGKVLTKLSNAFEAIEHTRHTQQFDIRGIIDGLPVSQQSRIMADIADVEASVLALGRFNPEVVTYVILGHMRTSMSLGRVTRAQAQSRMLNMLQDEGLAVPAEVFA